MVKHRCGGGKDAYLGRYGGDSLVDASKLVFEHVGLITDDRFEIQLSLGVYGNKGVTALLSFGRGLY